MILIQYSWFLADDSLYNLIPCDLFHVDPHEKRFFSWTGVRYLESLVTSFAVVTALIWSVFFRMVQIIEALGCNGLLSPIHALLSDVYQ